MKYYLLCKKHLTTTLFFVLFIFLINFPADAATVIDLHSASSQSNLVMDMAGFEAAPDSIPSPQKALETGQWKNIKENQHLLEAPRQYSTLWLHATLSNTDSHSIVRWLEISPWRLSTIDAWLIDPQTGEEIEHFQTGRDIPITDRQIASIRALIPIDLPANTSRQLLIRIYSDSRPFLTINSWNPIDFISEENNRYFTHSILLAIILTLSSVLIIQFKTPYLLASFWTISMFIFESEKEGYISYLLFNTLTDYADNIRFSSAIIAKALFAIFSTYLLGLRHHYIWRWTLPVATFIAIFYSVLTFILDSVTSRNLASFIHVAFSIAWISMLPTAIKQKHPKQLLIIIFLCLAWTTSTTFVLMYIFNIDYTAEFATMRIIIEAIVVLGLLLVYARQKRDKEKSLELQLRHHEKASREQLEQKVTERTQQLHQALAEAKKANDSKTNFLRQVTHDLKSPLTSIMGYAQLLRAESGSTGKMSNTIYSSAQHMLNMINRLIDYARDATTNDINISDIYLYSFLHNIKNESIVLAKKNHNIFTLKIDTTLCTVISCDETFLKEILLNLIDNACRNTVKGYISLGVAYKKEVDKTPAQLTFIVKDSGIGIPPEKKEQIFEPFYRVDHTKGGAGLGLSIVQELVNKLGGEIQLNSTLDVGTEIHVRLPVQVGSEAKETALEQIPNHVLPCYNAQGLSAWLVEDAKPIRQLLTQELCTNGFYVTSFQSAEEAISALQSNGKTPDLIITDHQLPDASGDSVLKAAKQRRSTLPVILLSATWYLQRDETELVSTLQPTNHYSAYLGKPIDLAHLRRSIAAICQLQLSFPQQISNTSPPTPLDIQQPFDLQTYLPSINTWLELGAVTDFIEFCNKIEIIDARHADLAQKIRGLAERGDFKSISVALDNFILEESKT
jgi:signal transduction histidine kinase/ActR/RegA family two-component response regulator